MSELEELPSWAGRSSRDAGLTSPATPPPTDDTPTETATEATPEAPPAGQPPTKPVVAPPGPAQPAPPQSEAQPIVGRTAEPSVDEPAVHIGAQPAVQQVTEPAPVEGSTVQQDTVAEAPTTPLPVEGPDRGQRRKGSLAKKALFALVVLAVLAGAAFGGFLLADARNDGGSTTADPAGPSTGEEATADGSAGAGSDESADADAEATSTGASTETTAGTDEGEAPAGEDGEPQTVTVEVADDESQSTDGTGDGATDDGDGADEAPMNSGNRQAFFRGGKVYLTGAVPSEEIGELIVSKAAEVVGPENVVNEYTIDPSATIDPGSSAPLYVEDVILFEFNSIEISQAFLPILDLGTLLLRQNPQASVTVVTRTDATGSVETNLEVARRRAQAVINYWVGQGVDPDQIQADPRGEEGASEDDDTETAAKQRRAEFVITGLLD